MEQLWQQHALLSEQAMQAGLEDNSSLLKFTASYRIDWHAPEPFDPALDFGAQSRVARSADTFVRP